MASEPAQTKTRELPLDVLVVEGSSFAPLRGMVDPSRDVAVLAASLAGLGQLTPLLVRESEAGRFELIDGFRRVAAARELGRDSLACQVVAATAPALIDLLIAIRGQLLAGSAVARARLIELAHGLGMSDDEMCPALLERLGQQPHQRVLRSYLAVAQLPAVVVDFCASKGFSLKQCAHLTSYSSELLELVFSWREHISLTASLSTELLDDLRDYAAIAELAPSQLAALPVVRGVLESGHSPQVKGRLLRDRIRELRAPVLTGANARLEALCADLGLAAHVALDWDRSLERHELRWAITVRDVAQWRATMAALADDSVAGSVAAMLEEL
jgi:hypothetical protein